MTGRGIAGYCHSPIASLCQTVNLRRDARQQQRSRAHCHLFDSLYLPPTLQNVPPQRNSNGYGSYDSEMNAGNKALGMESRPHTLPLSHQSSRLITTVGARILLNCEILAGPRAFSATIFIGRNRGELPTGWGGGVC